MHYSKMLLCIKKRQNKKIIVLLPYNKRSSNVSKNAYIYCVCKENMSCLLGKKRKIYRMNELVRWVFYS